MKKPFSRFYLFNSIMIALGSFSLSYASDIHDDDAEKPAKRPIENFSPSDQASSDSDKRQKTSLHPTPNSEHFFQLWQSPRDKVNEIIKIEKKMRVGFNIKFEEWDKSLQLKAFNQATQEVILKNALRKSLRNVDINTSNITALEKEYQQKCFFKKSVENALNLNSESQEKEIGLTLLKGILTYWNFCETDSIIYFEKVLNYFGATDEYKYKASYYLAKAYYNYQIKATTEESLNQAYLYATQALKHFLNTKESQSMASNNRLKDVHKVIEEIYEKKNKDDEYLPRIQPVKVVAISYIANPGSFN